MILCKIQHCPSLSEDILLTACLAFFSHLEFPSHLSASLPQGLLQSTRILLIPLTAKAQKYRRVNAPWSNSAAGWWACGWKSKPLVTLKGNSEVYSTLLLSRSPVEQSSAFQNNSQINNILCVGFPSETPHLLNLSAFIIGLPGIMPKFTTCFGDTKLIQNFHWIAVFCEFVL